MDGWIFCSQSRGALAFISSPERSLARSPGILASPKGLQTSIPLLGLSIAGLKRGSELVNMPTSLFIH